MGTASPWLKLKIGSTLQNSLLEIRNSKLNVEYRIMNFKIEKYSQEVHAIKHEKSLMRMRLFVENIGFEPMTSSMPWKRSSQLS